MSETEYEFTEEQNGVLTDLAKKMKFVAIFEWILGGISILAAVFAQHWEGLGNGILNIVIATFTFKASQFFQAIVDSQGNDITNLMKAMLQLKSLYSIQFWFTILSIVFIVLALVLVGGLAVAAGGNP